jgi:hypothetical protein
MEVTMPKPGAIWSRNETIITYYYLVKNNYSKNKDIIKKLAKMFGRSYGSVDWKMTNLLNPGTNGSKQDRDILGEFKGDTDHLSNVASTAQNSYPYSISVQLDRIFK